jgi:DNA-directed RNA polymerase subunit RPC12/RpoP
MPDPVLPFTIWCGLLCLGSLGIILALLIHLGRKSRPGHSPDQGKVKGSNSADNEPYLPLIHVRGGPDEWPELLGKLNLQTGDTTPIIEAKAYVMVQTIRSIDAAFSGSLLILSASASAAADGLDAEHPLHPFADKCRQTAQDWETDIPALRTACLEKGTDNSVTLECLVTGMVDWLARLDPLAGGIPVSSTTHPIAGDVLDSLLNQLHHLLRLRECLRQRDFSWLVGLPRATFVNLDELQRTFSDHFKPLGQPAIIPREDILARRAGRLQVNPVTQVSYSFGRYRDYECLQFKIKVTTHAGAHPVTTNWRLLSTLQTIKLAPYICEYCGDAVEGQSWTCSECGYDILYHATHPEPANPTQ